MNVLFDFTLCYSIGVSEYSSEFSVFYTCHFPRKIYAIIFPKQDLLEFFFGQDIFEWVLPDISTVHLPIGHQY